MNFTTVLVVDEDHLEQLKIVWPTWVKHRHEIMENPIVVMTDGILLTPHLKFIHATAKSDVWIAGIDNMALPRPHHHRHKMLSAFIDAAARYVKTEYWLKLDTDTIAMSRSDDGWIDDDWFLGSPAIIAPAWGYSKPADIMERLDDWGDTVPALKDKPRLELHPEPGSRLVRHKRITSWCSFYNTAWTRKVRSWYDGPAMPVESQDGFAWYCATRAGDTVHRVNMKKYGWQHISRTSKLRELAKESLCHED